MIQSIKSLLNPTAEKLVEVSITRNCSIGGTPYEIGETIRVSESTARKLIHEDAAEDLAADGIAAEKRRKLEGLLPPPIEPRPAPDEWKPLPACFSSWWILNEKKRVLIRRADDIEEVMMEKLMRFTPQPDMSSLQNVPNAAHRSALIQGIALSLHVGDIPESYQSECRFLKDVNARAQKAVSDWKEANHSNLIRLNIECSDAVFFAHGELNRACRELSDTALAIFRARLAPLGLSEMKICELFSGSADAQKYHSVAPRLQNVKMLWFHDSGRDQKSYIDFPVSALAQFFEQWTERNKELSALLKVAKAELAKALKVAA